MKHNILAMAAMLAVGGNVYRHAQLQDAGDAGGGTATANDSGNNKPKKEIKDYTANMQPGMAPVVFHFRKEKLKDPETGAELSETWKHPSIKVPMPVPTKEEVLAIMSSASEGEGNRASEQKFILDLIADAFYQQARDQINDWREDKSNAGKEVDASALDYSKITITALANMPASERGNKPSDEEMEDFIKDYVAVMPAASGKSIDKVKAQANVLEKQLRTVRTDKKVLTAMEQLLTIYAASTSSMEENQKVYDFLTGRIKRWLEAEPKNVLAEIL